MKVELRAIDSIKPYGFNNRKHPEEQVKRIAKSIQEFGFDQPIVVDKEGEIIIGHGRWMAAKYLGLDKVPVLQVDGLTEQQIRARRILDNKLQNDSSWDFDNLNLELDWLEDSGFDFEPWALNDLRFDGDEEPEIAEDEAPDVEEKAKYIKLGDLIELGPHRIICGDTTSTNVIIDLFQDDRCEVCFTSPPYSDMREYTNEADISISKISSFLSNWEPFSEYLVVNLGIKFEDSEIVPYWNEYLSVAKQNDLKLLAWNVWDKTQGGSIASATAMFLLTHEWLFVFGKERKKLVRTKPNQIDKYEARHGPSWRSGIKNKSIRESDGSMSKTSSATYSHHQLHSVIQQTPELSERRKDHPAIFPIGLPAEYIKAMTKEGEIVGDSFLGSGTTLIAADQLGRICYGIEISPQYCEAIIKRWVNYCKEKSKPYDVRINGQKTGPWAALIQAN